MNRKTLTATRARINRRIEHQSLKCAELTKNLHSTNQIIAANQDDWPKHDQVTMALVAVPQAMFYSLLNAIQHDALIKVSNSFIELAHCNDEIAALGPATRVKRQRTPAAAQLALL